MRRLAVWLVCLSGWLGAAAPAGATADGLLIDDRGHPVAPSALTGRWLLVTFGYTRCPDVCPTTLHRLAAVLAQLPRRGDEIDTYFVSVDPAHDTPAQLHRFLSPLSPRLRGLTGSVDALNAARRTFGVPARSNGAGIDHGVFIYLVAPDGRVVETLHPSASVAQMTERIRAHLPGPTSPERGRPLLRE